jgi:hypothetical protein
LRLGSIHSIITSLYMRTVATVLAACLLTVPSAVWGQGLLAVPTQLFFSLPAGAGPSSQEVAILFNGVPVTINGLSISTTTGQNWLQAFFNPNTGFVTAIVSSSGLSSGTFSGIVVVTTTAGTIAFQVNLTVGAPPPVTPAPPSLILILTGLAAAGLYQMRRKTAQI